MSIIQEALHKAEVDIKAPESSPDASQVKITPEVTPAPRQIAKKIKKKLSLNKAVLPAFVLLTLAAFALFSIGQFSSVDKKSHDKVQSPASTQDATYRPIVKADERGDGAVRPQDKAIPAASLRDITDHPGLTLNGIMYIEEYPKAIINNSIVEAGDLVSGAKVTKINPKNVVLEYNDVEITLNLK